MFEIVKDKKEELIPNTRKGQFENGCFASNNNKTDFRI